MLDAMLKERNISMYQCAKLSGIPYTTLSEVVRGKTRLEKCSAETVYKLSKILNVSMEELLTDSMEPRPDFEIFKSNVCHLVKDRDELDFIVETLQKDEISKYWSKKWYPEAFYLLAMVDYLSRENDLPLCSEYNDLRSKRLAKPLYPMSVMMADAVSKTTTHAERSYKAAIPEFLRFNIIESEIRNVV